MQRHPSEAIWQARAHALVDAVGAVLLWAQRTKGHHSTEDCVAELMSLRSIVSIAQNRRLPVPYAGKNCFLSLKGIPPALLDPLRRYLDETGGYDRRLPYDGQRSDEPQKQHGYVLWFLGQSLPGRLA